MEIERKHPKAKCEECPLYERGRYVPPDFNGNSTCKYVLVGEAPGATEVRKKRPFLGISGKLLEAVLKEHGISRSDTVMTNACLCRGMGNETPTADAIAACKPALDDVIEQADPDYVVTMGVVATTSLLGRKVKITQERVGLPKAVEGKRYKIIPTIHPAALLRNTGMFNPFVRDIGKLKGTHIKVKWEPPRYKVLDDEHKAKAGINQLLNDTRRSRIIVDLEVGEDKDFDYGHPNTLLAAGICYEAGKVGVIGRNALRSNSVRRLLSTLLEKKSLTFQNGKYDVGVLYRMGYGIFKIKADTMLMSHTQDETPGTHSLGYLGQELLGTPDWKKIRTKYKSFSDIPPKELYEYNAIDCGVTWDLEDYFEPLMDEHDKRYHEYLCWANQIISIIESDGIYIDVEALDELESTKIVELDRIKKNQWSLLDTLGEDRLWAKLDERTGKLIGKDGFNPNSTPQVKGVLEALLGARVVTTDADFLEFVVNYSGRSSYNVTEEAREFCRLMLDWRKESKLYGTYIKGTKIKLNDEGRIQTTFKVPGTETGRLSSVVPNVQNVPRGPLIRSIYSAAPGNVIIYADYGNIEGRVVCTLCHDEQMREDLEPGKDIHSVIAKALYGPSFTYEQRVLAKTVVHGMNYERTSEGISSGLGVPIGEAKKVYNYYHRRYPNVKKWQQEIRQQILHTEEELVSPWGAKRRFGLITRDNMEDVAKEGLAFLPQNIASNIALTAGCRMKEQGMDVRILIHDGIMVEAPERHAPRIAKEMEEIMMQSGREYTDYVEFPVDIAIGRSWGEVESE